MALYYNHNLSVLYIVPQKQNNFEAEYPDHPYACV